MTTSTVWFRPSVPRRPSVYFNENPIESSSRPLYHNELNSLRQFENHVYDSTSCYQSLKALRLTAACSYCRKMTGYILTLFEPWAGKYLQVFTHSRVPTFVEIPKQFAVTRYVLRKLMKDDSYRQESIHQAARHSKRYYSFTGSGVDPLLRRWSFPEMYHHSNQRYDRTWYEQSISCSLERVKITEPREWAA